MRVRGAVLAGALGLSALVLAPAAEAAPAVPVLSNLSTSTAGHLTGTVSSPGAPTIHFFFYRPDQNGISSDAGTIVLNDLSGPFDLPTWGNPGTLEVRAAACALGQCSALSDPVVVHPTDVSPDATWSTDLTINAGTRPTVTVSDTGGGSLMAVWSRTDIDGPDYYNLVAHNGPSTLSAFGAGPGRFTLYRCATPYAQCTTFAPDVSQDYTSLGFPQVRSNSIPLLTQAHPLATATITGSLDRYPWPAGSSFELGWAVQTSTGRIVTSGKASGPLAPDQTVLKALSLDGRKFPDGTLGLIGHLTVHTTDFGDLHGSLVNSQYEPFTFQSDAQGPRVVSMSVSPTTIYPRLRTASYPGTASFTIKSATNDIYKTGVFYGSKLVRTISYRFGNNIKVTGTWNGKKGDGTIAPAGRYRLYALDVRGNRSTMYREIVVSGRS